MVAVLRSLLRILRFSLAVVWFYTLAVAFLLFACFRPFKVSNGLWFCRVLSPVFFRILGVKFVLKHEERLRRGSPTIFVANHQSTLDFFFFGPLLPDNTVTVVKRGIIWIPVFGGLYLLSGNFSIRRRRPREAARTMRKIARSLVRHSRSILIFPEGTRSLDRGMGRFKSGAFRLAQATGYPIQPIAISTYFHRLDLRRWHAGTVTAEVLEPIEVQGTDKQSLFELIAMTEERVRSSVRRLDSIAPLVTPPYGEGRELVLHPGQGEGG